MSDLCARCFSKPAVRAISVEVLQFSDAIRIEGKDHVVESSWCVRLCEDCCGVVHGGIKQQTKFLQPKFKVGDVVGARKGYGGFLWPAETQFKVSSINVGYSVPLYTLNEERGLYPEAMLEAK